MANGAKVRTKVLVVGGAGYVGSATCAALVDAGHEVWVLDDLSTGSRLLALGDRFIEAKAGDRSYVTHLLQTEKFDCVMHFAAKCLVSESMRRSEDYFEANVEQTRGLLDSMVEAGTKRFVFSSTCAVFGNPAAAAPIHEKSPQNPINPYGESKLAAEKLIAKYALGFGIEPIVLRYFNAAGAESNLRVGEWHTPETHLIPNLLQAAESDKVVPVYGSDYETPDGTCVRDYVHVSDLARAHISAMNRLMTRKCSFEAYNLGTGKGSSILEVIRKCEQITGKKIRYEIKGRREGDPPILVADAQQASGELGFQVDSDSLGKIISSAWAWEKKKNQPRKAVFLDRDGTLNEDPGYLSRPDQMKLLPDVGPALQRLRQSGYELVIVSNQSGVGRGLIRKNDIPRINERMDLLLREHGVTIAEYELCFHRPEEGCDCRKPRPTLIQSAARRLGIDIASSYMVGDKISDVQSGRAAGCKGTALVRTGEGLIAEQQLKKGEADFIGDSLKNVVDWILLSK